MAEGDPACRGRGRHARDFAIVITDRHSGSRNVYIGAAVGPEAGEVTLRVVDVGHGIAPENQRLIFEKFRRAPGATIGDAAADTGLGLPFSNLAVERLGGRITLTSHPGETVLAVTLPVHDPGAA